VFLSSIFILFVIFLLAHLFCRLHFSYFISVALSINKKTSKRHADEENSIRLTCLTKLFTSLCCFLFWIWVSLCCVLCVFNKVDMKRIRIQIYYLWNFSVSSFSLASITKIFSDMLP
jgi:hypothetical protein